MQRPLKHNPKPPGVVFRIPKVGASQTVRAAMGAVPSDTVDVFPWAYDLLDPNLDNDLQVIRVPLGYVFVDGFESGDTSGWSIAVP